MAKTKDYLTKKKPIYISVVVTDDSEIKKLNKEYLHKDYATDVLSFNIDEDSADNYFLGEIVVNKEQAKRQAADYENSLEEEIADLVAHGVLHLLGIHHDGDEH